MSKKINLDPSIIDLDGPLRFYSTNAIFFQFDSYEVMELLKNFSSNRYFLCMGNKNNTDIFFLFNNVIISCYVDDSKTSLGIKGIRKANFNEHNRFYKFGITFKMLTNYNCTIQCKNDKYIDVCAFVNGNRKENPYEFDEINSSGTIKFILNRINTLIEETEETDEEYIISEKAKELLYLSEQYSIISNDLEKEKALTISKLFYTEIVACDYERQDRVAYGFVVNEYDEKIYKSGVQIQIENYEESIFGEIINVDKEERLVVNILFNGEVSIDDIPKEGFIGLSFSTVNMDVQLDANKKLSEGKAANKFFVEMIGKNKYQGFDNNDLSYLDERFSQREYPPNESQVNAIKKGINTKDIFLVMGPPGTGKTTVILEWIDHFVKKEKKRVLITSQNNKAVDNVLERYTGDTSVNCIRIGSESKVQSNVAPLLFEKKLVSTREEISTKSKEIIGKIESDSKKVDVIIHFLKECRGLVDDMDTKLSILKKIIKEQLTDNYKQVMEYKNSNKKLQKYISWGQKLINFELKIYSFFNQEKNKFLYYISIIPTYLLYYLLKKNRYFVCLLIKKYNINTLLIERELKIIDEKINLIQNNEYNEYISSVNQFNEYYESEWKNNELELCATLFSTEFSLKESDFENKNIVNDRINEISLFKQNYSTIYKVLDEWILKIENNQNYFLNNMILESVNVVGATCIGINSQKRFAGLDFDVTIVDEAGQIQIHNALVPISTSNKLIMLGDHKQIPPTADQDMVAICKENSLSTEYLEKSLFEILYHEVPNENKIMLDTQYRMPAEVADIISNWFYDGEYYSPSFKKNSRGLLTSLSEKPFIFIDTSKEQDRFETPIENAGCHNQLEANIIDMLFKFIDKNDLASLNQVGIISAYSSQVKLIKKLLSRNYESSLIKELVATLDSFQGQERNIIIYSFTKSSKKSDERRRIGFLNELRRLNVAMTRCKKTLVLIGDIDFLVSCKHQDADEEGNLIYEQSEKQYSDFIITIVEAIRNGSGELIEYSDFVNRVEGMVNERE